MTTKDRFPRRLFSLQRSATATISHHISTDNSRWNNSKKKSIDLPSISLKQVNRYGRISATTLF